MRDAQPADGGAGPPVDVEFADGQTVQAALIQRRQEQDGTWWYRLRPAGIWAREEKPDGTVRAVPDDVVFDALAGISAPAPASSTPAPRCRPGAAAHGCAAGTTRSSAAPARALMRHSRS